MGHEIPRHDTLVSQLLRDSLIPRDLGQLSIVELVIAGISDLKEIRPRPHTDEECERGRHSGRALVLRGALLYRLAAPQCALLKCLGEIDALFVEPIVTTGALG